MSPDSPFANRRPPKFIRGKMYKYHFETEKTNNWWRREYQVWVSPQEFSLLRSSRLQGEYLPVLSADNDQLVTFLTNQGYIGPETDQSENVLTILLAAVRSVCRTVPPHIQIWTYAWLCLPAILFIMKKAALSN